MLSLRGLTIGKESGGDCNGQEKREKKGERGETQGGKAKTRFQEGEITSGGKNPVNLSYASLYEGFWVPYNHRKTGGFPCLSLMFAFLYN